MPSCVTCGCILGIDEVPFGRCWQCRGYTGAGLEYNPRSAIVPYEPPNPSTEVSLMQARREGGRYFKCPVCPKLFKYSPTGNEEASAHYWKEHKGFKLPHLEWPEAGYLDGNIVVFRPSYIESNPELREFSWTKSGERGRERKREWSDDYHWVSGYYKRRPRAEENYSEANPNWEHIPYWYDEKFNRTLPPQMRAEALMKEEQQGSQLYKDLGRHYGRTSRAGKALYRMADDEQRHFKKIREFQRQGEITEYNPVETGRKYAAIDTYSTCKHSSQSWANRNGKVYCYECRKIVGMLI